MAKSDLVFKLKVILQGSRPPIWRRVLVPGDLTLRRLHEVLQVLMGCDGRPGVDRIGNHGRPSLVPGNEAAAIELDSNNNEFRRKQT